MNHHDWLLEMTKEITIAKMTNTNVLPNEAGGKNVADFMEIIFNKLTELDKKDNQ